LFFFIFFYFLSYIDHEVYTHHALHVLGAPACIDDTVLVWHVNHDELYGMSTMLSW